MAKLDATLEITAIGARGDGLARMPDGDPVYVPATAPGDIVRVRLEGHGGALRGRVVEIVREGADRAQPVCRHFGTCGGCALQHLDEPAYRAWKLDLLRNALARQGVAADTIEPLVVTPPHRRRRADFTAKRRRDDVLLGFNARASHSVVDLTECAVLTPDLFAIVDPLRALLFDLLPPSASAEIAVNRTDSGLDLLLRSGVDFGLAGREAFAAFAEAHDLARVSRQHPKVGGAEVIAERRPVRMTFGGVPVSVPPGAFIQASAEGEAALTAVILEAASGARRIADLYAGCGTFTFALAGRERSGGKPKVHAVEVSRTMIEALDRAAKAVPLPGVSAERRNLDKKPLTPEELVRTDLVVFDPPRAGAKAQAFALAEASVETIVAVSCNPATFARDARILLDGGFGLSRLVPVDQFLWAAHLEVVAVFSRR